MDMDALEGYADRLAGAGKQNRSAMALTDEEHEAERSYHAWFVIGSLDRKTMLTRQNEAET
jgi:hypothetical protein